jgi:hypothetical protein
MNSKKAHDASARFYNRNAQKSDLQAGELVMLRNNTMKSEGGDRGWPTRFIGPYRILRRTENNVIIKGVFHERYEQRVNLNRVKRAYINGDEVFRFNNENAETRSKTNQAPQENRQGKRSMNDPGSDRSGYNGSVDETGADADNRVEADDEIRTKNLRPRYKLRSRRPP